MENTLPYRSCKQQGFLLGMEMGDDFSGGLVCCAVLLVEMEREERSRRWPVPPQQALVDVGAQPRPAATLRGACAVLPHQMKMKSPIPSFLVAPGGCPGQIRPLEMG